MRPAHVGAFALNVAFIFASAAISCADGTPEPKAASQSLPPYAERATALFDDRIEPEAVGYPLNDVTDSAEDPILGQRVQVADAVVRVRVVTVTSEEKDTGPLWQIGLTSLENLAGARPPPSEFTIQVGPQDPAAGLLRALEGRLVGMTWIAFVREFGATSGSQLHFHVATDRKDEVSAIRAAALLARIH